MARTHNSYDESQKAGSTKTVPYTGDKFIDELIAINHRDYESSIVPGAIRPKAPIYNKKKMLKERGDTRFDGISEAEMDKFLVDCKEIIRVTERDAKWKKEYKERKQIQANLTYV